MPEREQDKPTWLLWLWVPLFPVVYIVVCLGIAVWAVLYVVCLPWLLLHPEYERHDYDWEEDPRKREAVRRWRAYCRRVPPSTRVARLIRGRARGC